MLGTILVAGTTSDAGKSVVTAGLCRWLARRGVRVAPFKAQNMSLNSMVTVDGGEIGRAQAMQAAAAGVPPEMAMNPVLLKPGGDGTSQVVVHGVPVAEAGALDYRDLKPQLMPRVLDDLADLRRRFDVVVCEGAGSPAEINLRATDITNMGLARAAHVPTVVVGDIDRGGVFAGLYGTLALLEPDDQRLVCGFVVNKFRGDVRLLEPGLRMLHDLTGRPVLGVLPWQQGLWLDVEDSLDLAQAPARRAAALPAPAGRPVRVAVVALPRLSNFTDVDALACEPGVHVQFTTRPDDVLAADLVVLPGSRATVADLAWVHGQGLAQALRARVAAGDPTIGVCGGFQMLARTIDDPVESRAGVVDGLGLLPVDFRFEKVKTLALAEGEALGVPVRGYEIHHGVPTVHGGEAFLDGCRVGDLWGTTWHGVFENDAFRRAFLARVVEARGLDTRLSPDTSFEAVRQQRLDALGDLVADHLDTGVVLRLLEHGPTPDLPVLTRGVLA